MLSAWRSIGAFERCWTSPQTSGVLQMWLPLHKTLCHSRIYTGISLGHPAAAFLGNGSPPNIHRAMPVTCKDNGSITIYHERSHRDKTRARFNHLCQQSGGVSEKAKPNTRCANDHSASSRASITTILHSLPGQNGHFAVHLLPIYMSNAPCLISVFDCIRKRVPA